MGVAHQKPNIESDDRIIVGTYLPEGIKTKVKEEAKQNMRSISGQISWIIDRYYKEKEKKSGE